jgi:hypothetical protein
MIFLSSVLMEKILFSRFTVGCRGSLQDAGEKITLRR